jgi:hypothetical protein
MVVEEKNLSVLAACGCFKQIVLSGMFVNLMLTAEVVKADALAAVIERDKPKAKILNNFMIKDL